MKQTIRAILLACTFLLPFNAFGESSQARLVTWGDWGPYVSEDLPDKGIASAVAKQVFESPEREVELVFHPWARAYEEAKEGLFLATFPFARNEEREQDFYFTRPLFQTTQRLFAAHEHSPSEDNFRRLGHPTICLPQGYNTALAERIFREAEIIIEQPREMVHCLRMVLMGRVDFVLVAEAVGWYTIDNQPGLSRGDFRLMRWQHQEPVHIMIPRILDDAEVLLEEANARIEEMQTTGAIDDIFERYRQYLPEMDTHHPTE